MVIESFKYKIWADERTMQAITHINQSEFPDIYRFVLQQINHMVIVEELFKSRLLRIAAPHKNTNSDVVPEYDELKQRLIESGKWYQSYISKIDERNKRDVLAFTFVDRKNGSMSVEEILFHVVNHGSYHRGSIAHALDFCAVPHPPDGYGMYIHEKEPGRRGKTEESY